MARRRRKKRNTGSFLILSTLGLAAAGSWWFVFGQTLFSRESTAPIRVAPKPLLMSDRPDVVPPELAVSEVEERGSSESLDSEAKPLALEPKQVDALIAAGREALKRDDLVAARTHLGEAFTLCKDEATLTKLRADLTRLADQTVFSRRVFQGDPLVQQYIIKSGDSLVKIAKTHTVTDDLLASLNGIVDKNLIRAGRTLKIINGPFHAVINKSTFTMDVYLGTTFVRYYRVGLGEDDSTPEGEWKVGTKLVNPTYYPPRGGQIISADDPKNPLGERWIGLIGVGGDAAGQQRYGIHGTVEPESVGKNASLGCIRMFNEDVEALYVMLIEGKSEVVIQR